ncbi:MAG: two-component system, OmpR family, response regulator MtrA [Frankiaceae bacterium]|jgi:DNA-binding response OmpR family regulator|nr:two-component system, OmpR family, response regulator MtrA [Frankiaceae bacterium]
MRTVSKPHVLLVDDDEDVRHMTRVSLGFEGFEVTAVGDGQAGLDAARADRPDAMILDVMMPGIDGLDVLRQIRADPALHGLPVLLLTAKAGVSAEHEGWTAGATAYLTKPFTGTALAATLRGLLESGAADARATALARLDLVNQFDRAADNLSDQKR